MSFTGYTGYKVASQRPKAAIYVFTSNKQILTQLNLVWGVKGIYYDKTESTDNTIMEIKAILKNKGILKENDLVINIASMPIEAHGNSNMIKLSHVE
jgi:pyruvate kinase